MVKSSALFILAIVSVLTVGQAKADVAQDYARAQAHKLSIDDARIWNKILRKQGLRLEDGELTEVGQHDQAMRRRQGAPGVDLGLKEIFDGDSR